MIFQRKIYESMLAWKREQNGRTALLVKGARRVGKTTIVEEFARREYRSYILVDFAHISPRLNALFDDLSDLDDFFAQLQLLSRRQLYRRQSVVVFDEIQLKPTARQAIKYLVADGRYDYIETGSLLSIKKNIKGILIPSEETRLTMHPLDYEEFRWALDDHDTFPMLKEAFERRRPLGQAVIRKLMRDFRYYMLVGGMPQAVNSFLETNDFRRVDKTKREILELYSDDFRRIDPSGTISQLFKAIPGELSKHASRYQIYSAAAGKSQYHLPVKVANMQDSLAVNFAYHADDPSVGLNLNRDASRFKIYLADTGLFTTLMFADKAFTENTIYERLLADKLDANLGVLFENAVAQLLTAKGDGLFYYTFPAPSGKHLYEIDFLLSRGNKLCPVEVKSSGYQIGRASCRERVSVAV